MREAASVATGPRILTVLMGTGVDVIVRLHLSDVGESNTDLCWESECDRNGNLFGALAESSE